jgi:hypothetical protein
MIDIEYRQYCPYQNNTPHAHVGLREKICLFQLKKWKFVPTTLIVF